ncbi:MAG TPA: hypothetical protein VET26_06040, partial [Candidatus Sulfotelmatobacter sp.]|nr:hypothetical protein [Candidatus Sulfotelmatobacter sp.]
LQLEGELNSLAPSGSVPTPSVIDRAIPPAHPDASRLPVELALALVIGVILGVAVASALEAFGPVLLGGDAIAGALGVPFLGTVPDPTGMLRDRITIAASAADVSAVELVGVGDASHLQGIAKRLKADDQDKGALPIFSSADAPSQYRKGSSSPSSGFVLVTPERIRRSALASVRNLLAGSGRPLLGVVVHAPEPAVRETQRTVRSLPRLAVVRRNVASEPDPLDGMSQEVASDLWGGR